MANILGLGGSLHDFSACLINERNDIIAIEDERLTKNRYSINSKNAHVPSVNYCLKNSNLDINDVKIIGDDMISDDFYPNRERLNHHMAHIYSTFFTSSFNSAAILILDGVGSLINEGSDEVRETTTYAFGSQNDIKVLKKIFGEPNNFRCNKNTPRVRSNSLGEFYRAVTEIIGFGFLQAGKTMGLFPFGDNRFYNSMLKFVHLKGGGEFEINMSEKNGMVKYLLEINCLEDFNIKASVANAAQGIMEYLLEYCLNYLWRITKESNLCLAGGVILNSVANGKIPSLSKFKNVHIISAPGDDGASIGSAIYGKLLFQSTKEVFRLKYSAYLGKLYSNIEILKMLRKYNLKFTKVKAITKVVAEKINDGYLVAYFQGKSEFGPRALGNRSILGDARQNKDRINKIKGREWFRPVAPIVISERLNDYFYAPFDSNYMQFVFPVKPEYQKILKGSTHIDNSARVQSVSYNTNPNIYMILKEFENITGLPILINTSFNIKGNPMVETPEDAILAFINSELDILVLENFLVTKC